MFAGRPACFCPSLFQFFPFLPHRDSEISRRAGKNPPETSKNETGTQKTTQGFEKMKQGSKKAGRRPHKTHRPASSASQQMDPRMRSSQTAAASEKWKPATLGVVINQYKRAATINARKIQAEFAWQSRFHDHIIRSDESFQ
jgi:hypothetical protein